MGRPGNGLLGLSRRRRFRDTKKVSRFRNYGHVVRYSIEQDSLIVEQAAPSSSHPALCSAFYVFSIKAHASEQITDRTGLFESIRYLL